MASIAPQWHGPCTPRKQLSNHKWLVTHNTFLQALSETGTLGFLLLASFFGAVLYRAWRAGRFKQPGREGVVDLMAALEIAFWGFIVCGLSGGYVMSWFPYLLAGLIGAAGRILTQSAKPPRTTGFAVLACKNCRIGERRSP